MEESARRLRGYPRYEDSIHLYQLPINKDLFLKFKVACVEDGITMRDKIVKLIESSLG